MAELTIIHTSDLHGRLTAAAAAALRALKQQHGALLLDSGDFCPLPNVLAVPWRLKITAAMEAAGYDAAGLGNREWFFRSAGVRWLTSRLPFPLVASNVVFPCSAGVSAFSVLQNHAECDPVAVLALTRRMVAPNSFFQGFCDSRWLPPEEALGRLLPQLREQAEWVIVLSHLGLSADLSIFRKFAIDVVLGGHDHILTPRPIATGKTVVIHSGCHGRWATVVRLARTPRGLRVETQAVRISNRPNT